MRITYESPTRAGAAYEIEADRFGNYTIMSRGKVIKRVTSIPNYFGRPRWGSRKLEMNAIEDATKAIEALRP